VPQGWPFRTGQDYLPNHVLSTIDYAAVHLWPDNWSRGTDRPWGVAWVAAHAAQAALLGKPLVLEEFGKFVGTHRTRAAWDCK
jgi:mannan endo-1,4-beta-mannosidase